MIFEKYHSVLNKIKEHSLQFGRDPNHVKLMLVTKNVLPDVVKEAFSFGHRLFGENKVQELKQKVDILGDIPIRFHFIGHLQTNKVRDCLHYATAVDSVDRLELVQKLDHELQAAGKSIDILIQVNTSGEEQKYGIDPSKLIDFVKKVSKYETLNIKGLMTLAVRSDDSEKIRKCFRLLKTLQEKVNLEGISHVKMNELSMGMSSDYKIAIEEGTTIVRIGTEIFGQR